MSAASDLIRASIEAIPEELREQQWIVHSHKMVNGERVEVHSSADGLIVTDQDQMYAGKHVAAYIALMDPTVAAAVADLLDEIHRPLDEREKYEDRLGVIHGKALAVEAAITRGAS